MAVDTGARRRRRSFRPLPLGVGVPLLALLVGAGCWQSVSAAEAAPASHGSVATAQAREMIESGRLVRGAGPDASGIAQGAAGRLASVRATAGGLAAIAGSAVASGQAVNRKLAVRVHVGLAHLAEPVLTLAPDRRPAAADVADRSATGQRAPPARLV